MKLHSIHFVILGCQLLLWGTRAEGLSSKPLPLRGASSGTLFEKLSPSVTGLDLVHRFPSGAPLVYLQEQGAGCGLTTGDIDGDGLPELFVTNYDMGCRLYRNLGRWKFEDITLKAGIHTSGRWCAGASFADIDNDGDLDLFVCCFNSPNLALINQGDGTFLDRAKDLGLDWTGASLMSAFADYDRDGKLDLFLLTHRDGSRAGQHLPRDTRNAADRGILRLGSDRKPEVTPEFRDLFSLWDKGGGRMELAIAGQPDQLFRQGNDGLFVNVTPTSGINGNDIGLGVSWWDYNADGWPDIYVANDHKTPDRLWRNNRDGTFTDVASSALSAVPLASMGTDAADVNNDGFIDLLTTEMAGSTHERRMVISRDHEKNAWFATAAVPRQLTRNVLHLGTGGEFLLESARMAGLGATDWTWSPKFGDFDNDGWVDLFIANGMSRDFVHADLIEQMGRPNAPGWARLPLLRESNLAFRNRGGLTFERTESQWGLGHVSASFGSALADFDADGDLDLAVMNLEEALGIYRNTEGTSHRLVIRLRGIRSNAWGVGARVVAETPGAIQTRCLQLASGYLSANEPLIHFGLGTSTVASKLTVYWPSGSEQSFSNVKADHTLVIEEPIHSNSHPAVIQAPTPWFRRIDALSGFDVGARSKVERSPPEISPSSSFRSGPALAVGDVNGDGYDDFFIGGSATHPGRFGIREPNAGFRAVTLQDLAPEPGEVDRGVLLFDADGDNDLDLYLVTGKEESSSPSSNAQDRLLLNDGSGHFVRAPLGTIPYPHAPGSVVVGADFDRDGDLDLFIGGAWTDSRHSQAHGSRLLRNTGGRFENATASMAPGLLEVDRVASAVFFDANNDGWIDLATIQEWGVLQLFLNRSGTLVPSTNNSGFIEHPGLWQGMAVDDLDGDGDLDLVTSNVGLNSHYPASAENPVELWEVSSGDNVSSNFIEAYRENGVRRPLRNRTALSRIIPSILEGWPSHSAYAQAALGPLLSSRTPGTAPSYQIRTLESGVWRNDGSGNFKFSPLPRLAQLAPGFGVIASDLNGDGISDLVLAQNDRGADPEFGPMNGGLGAVLSGELGPRFNTLIPQHSGIWLEGEGRALALLDVNGDAAPDLLVTRNEGPPVVFENRSVSDRRWIVIRLRGSRGNPSAIGARIELKFENGVKRMAGISAGGGWNLQSASKWFVSIPKTVKGGQFRIRWPEGLETSWTGSLHQSVVELAHPSSKNP